MFYPRLLVVAVAIAWCFSVAPLQAQIDWLKLNSENAWYDVGVNWAGGVAPGAASTARFNANAAYQVWWDGTTVATRPSVGFLQVVGGQVTFLNTTFGPQHELKINGIGG